MKTVACYGLVYKADRKSINYLPLASLDPAYPLEVTLYGPAGSAKPLLDPKTNRLVDDVSFDAVIPEVGRVQGQGAVLAYGSKYPFTEVSASVPTTPSIVIEESAPPTDEGDKFRYHFTALVA